MDVIKIGKFISVCRKEKELTQKDLADLLNVSDKTVSKWERGINLPDASLYYPLCEVLGISINELFSGERVIENKAMEKAEENIIMLIDENNINKRRINRIGNVFKVIALCLTPIIILQWNLKLVWVKAEMNLGVTSPPIADFYASLYWIGLLYFIAYFMTYKKLKIGYYMMWFIYLVLSFLYLVLTRTNVEYLFMFTSLDLWFNILLTIYGIISKEIQPSLLFKRT